MWLKPIALFLLPFVGGYFHEEGKFCAEMSCASKEDLLIEIQKYKAKLMELRGFGYDSQKTTIFPGNATNSTLQPFITDGTPSPEMPSCNICASTPCLNGGTCFADVHAPWKNFTCECPYNFAGSKCEKELSCDPFPCGKNAKCSISNHQVNCICNKGFSGDPFKNCSQSTKRARLRSDLVIRTFDAAVLMYEGTCPYIVSQPCTTLGGGYTDYVIKAKNKLIGPTSYVSILKEVEITFHNQTIHVNPLLPAVYFNGINVSLPFYWPSSTDKKISITYVINAFLIKNDEYFTVEVEAYHLCVEVPYLPNITVGKYGLCGLLGNINEDWKDDLAYRNGTTYPLTNQTNFLVLNDTGINKAQDTWITSFEMKSKNESENCLTAETMGKLSNTKCDKNVSTELCSPIQQAAYKQGPFALCSVMGEQAIDNWYQSCVVTLCKQPKSKCRQYKSFMDDCVSNLPPDTDQGPWRSKTECDLTCPINSHYSSCKSSCPNTCANHDPAHCNLGCTEGCTCDFGYVTDNTQLQKTTCIKVEECGCNDPDGNSHPASKPWFTDNCAHWNECVNGTYVVKNNTCGANAGCSISGGDMHCACNHGYEGDGHTCVDINECLNPSTCNQDVGQGNCTNTNGSYFCTCDLYYSDSECENYTPLRHCADLQRYHNIKASGYYTIYPPTENKKYGTASLVYCDMETDEGGWTLMSTAKGNEFAGKTYVEYQSTFGDPRNGTLWLGLDKISGITLEHNTSLRIDLERCPNFEFASSAQEIYKYFVVNPKEQNYTVFIPERANGNDTSGPEGWARWDLTKPGPRFVAFDNDDGEGCSGMTQKTGFWFDSSDPLLQCGAANLNGVRPACDGSVSPYETSYLLWNMYPLSQAKMYLRPTDYPNYDPVPPPPEPIGTTPAVEAITPVYTTSPP